MGRGPAKDAWNAYVTEHLLTRLHGYELMMAPYAIAHMKIGLKLAETGYRFGRDVRARVYLTNALEPVSNMGQMRLEHVLPALAHEAQEVNEIKRRQRFTVVIGNPPYSVTSTNTNPFIDRLQGTCEWRARISCSGRRLLEVHPLWPGASPGVRWRPLGDDHKSRISQGCDSPRYPP